MKTSSPALVEAFEGGTLSMISETLLSKAPFAGYNPSHCYKDRDLSLHLRIFDIKLDDFLEGGHMLVIGGGATRRFERELSETRPDLTVVSVDPLLRHGVVERQRESIRMGALTWPREEYGVRFPRELRTGEAYFRVGAVCGGIALKGSDRTASNYLPFRNRVFQHVIGLHSLPQYCAAQDVPDIMKEVLRVMEDGATARFYPTFPEDQDEILASDLMDYATSISFGGEDISRWHRDGAPGTRRLLLTK